MGTRVGGGLGGGQIHHHGPLGRLGFRGGLALGVPAGHGEFQVHQTGGITLHRGLYPAVGVHGLLEEDGHGSGTVDIGGELYGQVIGGYVISPHGEGEGEVGGHAVLLQGVVKDAVVPLTAQASSRRSWAAKSTAWVSSE